MLVESLSNDRGTWAGWVAFMLGLTLLLAWPATVEAADFDEELARIDEALAKSKANPRVLESCVSRRNAAVRLYETRQFERRAEPRAIGGHLIHVERIERT